MRHPRPLFISIPLAGKLRGIREAQSYSDALAGRLPTVQISERRRVVPVGPLAELAGVSVEQLWEALAALEADSVEAV